MINIFEPLHKKTTPIVEVVFLYFPENYFLISAFTSL